MLIQDVSGTCSHLKKAIGKWHKDHPVSNLAHSQVCHDIGHIVMCEMPSSGQGTS